MKKIIKSDLFRRAIKTFIQGILGSLAVSLYNVTTFDKTFAKGALISAFAAGFSALMNFIINILEKKENN